MHLQYILLSLPQRERHLYSLTRIVFLNVYVISLIMRCSILIIKNVCFQRHSDHEENFRGSGPNTEKTSPSRIRSLVLMISWYWRA